MRASATRSWRGGFVGPAARLCVGFEGLDVGELVGEGVAEFGCCDELSQVSQMLAYGQTRGLGGVAQRHLRVTYFACPSIR